MLSTLPREMVVRILSALAPYYSALCRAAQTCVFLRDIEATDKEALWKHICETLIAADARKFDTGMPPRFSRPSDLGTPYVMTETQRRLNIHSKMAVRLYHVQRFFGEFERRNHIFTMGELDNEFEFLLEVQYKNPSQNFVAPLSLMMRRWPAPDDDKHLKIGESMYWGTDYNWSTPTRDFTEALRVVLLARKKLNNTIATVLIGTEPRPLEYDIDTMMYALYLSEIKLINKAWYEAPVSLNVIAQRNIDDTGFESIALEIFNHHIDVEASYSTASFHELFSLATAVRSRHMKWVPVCVRGEAAV